MNNKKAVAEKLLQINAIKLSPDYPLTADQIKLPYIHVRNKPKRGID